jgi:hypothetical protein
MFKVEIKLKETNINLTKGIIELNHPFSKIKGPIFIGRTWKEYLRMFNLNLDDLIDGKVLDCAAGASSFKADLLCDKCKEHMEVLVEGLASVDSFIWSFFRDLEDLKEQRNQACSEFIMDYKNHKNRYISADLTDLPFEEGTFKMVLCSHLLFIYDHRLDYEFHLKSIQEMLRVSSSELRIYPLVKNRGLKSEFVNHIIKDLPDVQTEIVKVNYEFRKGGNEMLKLTK